MTKENPSKNANDQNLVEVTEDTEGLRPEDQLFIFWEKNKSKIIGLAILAVVAVIIFQGMQFFKAQAVTAMQASYQEAGDDSAALLTFAQKYEGKNLSGMAYLKVADQEFEKGEYEQALAHYEFAANNFQLPEFQSRARLGKAIALLTKGEKDSGKTELNQLLNSEEIVTPIRAQAAYKLIVLAAVDKNKEEAEKLYEQLSSIAEQSVWNYQAKSLVDSI